MRAPLSDKVQQLNIELEQLFSDLQSYSKEALNKSPSPGAWSATQIMHHVMLSEKHALQYCKKKLSFQPALEVAGFAAKLRAKLIEGYLKLPFKFKAPKAIDESVLPKESDLAQIIEEWKAQRQALAAFFNELPSEYLDKVVYKHPAGGRLSFDGMLGFFEVHFRRHQKQLIKALQFQQWIKNNPTLLWFFYNLKDTSFIRFFTLMLHFNESG